MPRCLRHRPAVLSRRTTPSCLLPPRFHLHASHASRHSPELIGTCEAEGDTVSAANRPLRTRKPDVALITFHALVTLDPLVAFQSLQAWNAGIPRIAFVAFWAGSPLSPLSPFRTGHSQRDIDRNKCAETPVIIFSASAALVDNQLVGYRRDAG